MNVAKNWLNNLKLRVGYGITGNSGGVDAYGTTTQAYVYTGNGLTLNGQNSSFTQYTGTYGSKDLGWEKSYNWNVGLDYGILNNRVDGSIEWFKTTTKGLLFKRTLPITSGLTGWGSPLSIWQNIAETSNQSMAINIPEFGVQILLRIFWMLMVLNPVLFRLKLWKKMVMVEYTNIVQMTVKCWDILIRIGLLA